MQLLVATDVALKEGTEEVGKVIHKISIHDMGSYFEIWFGLKDVSKTHHKKILEDIMERFNKLTWLNKLDGPIINMIIRALIIFPLNFCIFLFICINSTKTSSELILLVRLNR